MISPARINQGFPGFPMRGNTPAFPDFRRMTKSSKLRGLKCIIDCTKIDSSLTHFPVPVKLTSAHDFLFDAVGEDYLKLKIFKADQATEMYCEVEQWDSENQKALLWVSKSDWVISSTEDTKFYISYGDTYNTDFVGLAGSAAAQNVWNSDFEIRYGFAQDPSGGTSCMLDSTSNANHATPTGFDSADLVDALNGLGLDVDAETDKLEADTLITLSGEFHFAILLYMRSFGDEDALFGDDTFNDGRLSFWGSDAIYLTRSGNIVSNMPISLSQAFPTNTWAVLHVIRDSAGDVYVYIDDSSSLGSARASGHVDFRRLLEGPDDSGWEGMRDAIVGEVRLYSIGRSSAWRKADYHAQTNDLLTITE
jgi:hypothetical protein